MDGNWKLMFPHCMYPVKVTVPGLPGLSHPDIYENQTKELIISIDSLYDRVTKKKKENFTNMLHKSIPTYFTGILFRGILLCTYMARQKMMFVVYSDLMHVYCYHLPNCSLNDVSIANLKELVMQKIAIKK